jgi:hypothetical protein
VPEHLRHRVHEKVRERNEGVGSIHLQAYGTVSSDGYRPSPDLVPSRAPRPGMEANITALMALGLADRVRALHVLEAMNNNLEDALDMLLALQRQPAPQ